MSINKKKNYSYEKKLEFVWDLRGWNTCLDLEVAYWE